MPPQSNLWLRIKIKPIRPSINTSSMIFTSKKKFAVKVPAIIIRGRRSPFFICFESRSIATFTMSAVAQHCIPFKIIWIYGFDAKAS